MARSLDKTKALELRRKGLSYTQIKERLGVSKGTLSVWLRDMPLSESRLRELRDFSEQRIEKTRQTKRNKRLARFQSVYAQMRDAVGEISERELYIAGFFLYWGEGLKADPYTVMFTNTDPAMIKCFIKWIELLGVNKKDLKVYLHLYQDMNVSKATDFWSRELGLPRGSFRKPYVKKSNFIKSTNHKGRFGFGTCNVYVRGRDVREKVAGGIARLRELYGGVAFGPEKAL